MKTKTKIEIVMAAEGFDRPADFCRDLGIDSQQYNAWKSRASISKKGATLLRKKYGYTIDSLIDEGAALEKEPEFKEDLAKIQDELSDQDKIFLDDVLKYIRYQKSVGR